MSIILKGNNISTSNKGIGPLECTNIKASQNTSSIILSWTNPSNVVINGTTLSTFDHVIIVRNTSRVPNSEEDGTVVYNGKNTKYTDSNVTKNTKYYYRFFVYDTNKLCNNNMNMITECTFYILDPILKNNSWDQINVASKSGIASSLWKVGDEIDLTLSGTFNETVTLQIWDFNHFDKSDGTGKAGICFGMKNLMKDTQKMNNSDTNYGGWNNTYMKNTVMVNILKSMPSNLQSYIKEVNTYANAGNNSTSSSVGKLCKDKVFLPGFTELSNDWLSQNQTETNQKKFPIFTDDYSRIKEMNNGGGSTDLWWIRSPGNYNIYDFCYVGSDGGTGYNANGYSSNLYGVCFCFNV